MNFYKVKQPELLIFNYFYPQKQQFHVVWATAKVNVDLIFTFVSLILFNCKMCTSKNTFILTYQGWPSVTPINTVHCSCILLQEIKLRY